MSKEKSHEIYEQESEEMMGERYIVCKDSYYQPLNKCVTYMEPLLIDYSILTSSSSPQKAKEELQKFKSALSSWGCFQLINHGIQTSLLDEVQEVSRQFFGLTMEEKQRYAMLPNNATSGHGYQVGNNNSPSATTKVLDWNEGFSLALFPEDRIKLEFWPEFPPNFKDVIHEYTTRVTTIFDALFKFIVQSLNVDEERFAKQYGHNKEINLRLNFYPKFDGLEQVLGLKPHADFSTITMLLQDEEGLQVLKDEQWFMVPVIPRALFVNLGDPLEIMSNGILKSAVHRVVTNTEKERLSVVAFWDSDRNNEIGPLDELITNDRPQIYQTISLEDYIPEFLKYYQSGERVINTLKV